MLTLTRIAFSMVLIIVNAGVWSAAIPDDMMLALAGVMITSWVQSRGVTAMFDGYAAADRKRRR